MKRHLRGPAAVGFAAFLGLALGACAAPRIGAEGPPSPTPQAGGPAASPWPGATATMPSTPTPTPAPTATPTPHPLTIEWLRWQEYPASEIVIAEALEPGANYHRYLAYYRSEGLRINALLTVPFGDPPEAGWPVVIFNHGYIPPREYRTTERYVAYVDAFARQGYIVFRSDYRGHGDSEGFARGGYGSPDYTVDILNALAAVREFDLADPDRIGMWGHSMGGHITLRSMVVAEDIRAGVIWAGVVAPYPDLLERWRRRRGVEEGTPTPRPRGWRGSLYESYGSPQENPDFWASISANSYLDDLSGPLQLHHGTADRSVPVAFSRTLAMQVRAVDGQVELYEYEGDNHNIANAFSVAIQRSIYFFNEHVKGEGG